VVSVISVAKKYRRVAARPRCEVSAAASAPPPFFAITGGATRSGSTPWRPGVLAVTAWFAPLRVEAPLWIFAFALAGGGVLGALGVIAGIWAEKFDQLAAFQNFLVMPLTMLSGVFYSIHSLPEFWQRVSHYNPVFYMIDGFRYGFFGVSDVPPHQSLLVVVTSLAAVSALTLGLLKRGWKLRA
jgi:ABC-2 type transport system permease protein